MNILFLSDAFLPHAGGARVYYYNLYKNLACDAGNQVTVLTKKVPGWKVFDREDTSGLRIVRCGKPLVTWKYHELPKILFPLVRLSDLLARRHFDLVHFGDLYPPGVLSILLKRASG